MDMIDFALLNPPFPYLVWSHFADAFQEWPKRLLYHEVGLLKFDKTFLLVCPESNDFCFICTVYKIDCIFEILNLLTLSFITVNGSQ